MKSKIRVLLTLLFAARIVLIAFGVGVGLLVIPRVAVAQQDIVDDDIEDVSDFCDEGYDCELESYAAIYDTSSTVQLDVESETSVSLDALDDGFDSYDCAEVTMREPQCKSEWGNGIKLCPTLRNLPAMRGSSRIGEG
jgi:hypothetical protein